MASDEVARAVKSYVHRRMFGPPGHYARGRFFPALEDVRPCCGPYLRAHWRRLRRHMQSVRHVAEVYSVDFKELCLEVRVDRTLRRLRR